MENLDWIVAVILFCIAVVLAAIECDKKQADDTYFDACRKLGDAASNLERRKS